MTYPTFNPGEALPASDLNAIGLWLIKSETFSNASSHSVSSVFSSSYDSYRMVVTFSVSPQNLHLRFRTGSDDIGNVYQWARYYHRLDDLSSGVVGDENDNKIVAAAFNTTVAGGISLDIFNPNLARYTSTSTLPYSEYGTTMTNSFVGWSAAAVATTTQYTGVSIIANTGTMSGNVRVYGYRN